MTLDYQLTEKDMDLSLLTDEERDRLQQEMDERNNEYMYEVVQERDMDFAKEHEALLDKLAVQAGFNGYREDGTGNTVSETAQNMPDDGRLDKFESLKKGEEYCEHERLSRQFSQDDLDFLAESTQKYYFDALVMILPRMDIKEWMDKQSPLQVRLSGDDLYSALLTKDEAKNLRQDFDAFLQKWEKMVYKPLLKIGTKEARKAGYLVDCAAQVYYRNILATTCSRAVSCDTRGERILSPEEYLDRLAQCSDADEKRELKASITRQALCATLQGPKKVMVDYMLAPFLERLRIAGYVTGQSCSGLLADHPNYRYVSDDERGRFVKGECIHFNKQGSEAYITFWKPEADDVDTYRDVNSRGKMEDIRCMARQNGWTVEDTETFYLPSVKLMLPYTYDGSSKSQLSREASARVKEMYPKLWDENFDEFMNKKSAVLDELADRHGGVVRWTDKMIFKQWEKLVSSLELACRQRRETENTEAVGRISDVTVYMGGDGYHRIKCSIDGVGQLSERLSDIELTAINKGECPEAVAARVYSSVLAENKEEQNVGVKR